MDKKIKILQYLSTVESATTDEIIENTDINDYYYNGRFYIGQILSRLVKSACIVRVKKGTFKFISFNAKSKQSQETLKNHPKLF
jgi:predicted transcriptional regulator of viral defense system